MTKKYCLLLVISCVIGLSVANSSMADDEEEKDNSRNCIQTRTLKSTAVVDDRNVLFVKIGNSVYHNRLRKDCKGLGKYKQFSYTTTSGSLCSLDSIRVMDATGRESRSCQLGKFYEITTDELRALVEESLNPSKPDSQDSDKEESEPE